MEWLIGSFVFTWGLGLFLPIFLRYVFPRRSFPQGISLAIVVFIFLVQLIVSVGIFENRNGPHLALLVVAFVGYKILTYGGQANTQASKESRVVRNIVKAILIFAGISLLVFLLAPLFY